MAPLKSSNMTIRLFRPNLFSPVKQSVKDKFFWFIIPSLSFARVETFNTHSNISSRTWSWSDIAWPQVKMLSCSHSIYDMFFSKRKSRLTPKPSLRPDLHSTCRSKCNARTILSAMQDKSKKKGTATIDDKIVDSLPLKMQNSVVANQFYPLYPYFHSYSHSPFPHPPPPCTMLLCLLWFLKDERRNGGSFSILCRIMSRKVAAVHLLSYQGNFTPCLFAENDSQSQSSIVDKLKGAGFLDI